MTDKVYSNILNALIEDKISLENVVSADLMDKIKDSNLSKGIAYKQKNDNKVFFDQELETLFNEKTKDIIKELFESNFFMFYLENYLKFDLQSSEDFLLNRQNQITRRNTGKNKNSDKNKVIIKDKEMQERKFIILFLIFIHILSEISAECKERANLLYKFFKIYFV